VAEESVAAPPGDEVVERGNRARRIVSERVCLPVGQEDEVAGPQRKRIQPAVDVQPSLSREDEMEDREVACADGEAPRGTELGAAEHDALDAVSREDLFKVLAPIVADVQLKKTFADGNDVCLLYEMVTSTPAGTQPIAEWYRVRDGKIGAIQVYFDSRPFAALREG
jgi:hypothetical protein